MERHKGKVREVSEKELHNRLKSDAAEDRRTDPRVPARLEVEVPLSTWDEVRRVYTTNISKGGMLFTMGSPATIPAAIELVVALPDGGKVKLQSEVRHVSRRGDSAEFDVGVQFSQLDAASEKAFQQALSKMAK